MMKNLILLIACSVVLNANLNMKIENIIGSEEYNTHKNLINYVFQNQSSYYKNGVVDYALVTQKLQSNGLLKLKYSSSQYTDITFEFSNQPKKSLIILKEILKSLGHYYYFTQEAKLENSFTWSIKLKTEAAISPLALSEALRQRNCEITDIRKEGSYTWYYSINSNNSQIFKSQDLITNNELSLRKPTKPYMLKIANANAININSNSGNKWHPNVVFYDKELNVIEIFKEDNLQKNLRLDVPTDTKYIKIDDLYSLSNLRRGISITKE